MDRASNTTSDVGEDMESSVHSLTYQEGTEYINPRGVRFTPHQHTKDGESLFSKYVCLSVWPCVFWVKWCVSFYEQ